MMVMRTSRRPERLCLATGYRRESIFGPSVFSLALAIRQGLLGARAMVLTSVDGPIAARGNLD